MADEEKNPRKEEKHRLQEAGGKLDTLREFHLQTGVSE